MGGELGLGPTRADEVEEEDGEGEREEETGSDGACWCSCGGCGGDRDNNISRLTFAPRQLHTSALIIISSATRCSIQKHNNQLWNHRPGHAASRW